MYANDTELYIVVVRIYKFKVFRMIFSLTFTEYRTGCKLTDSNLRRVHTMKVMCIGSELICIVYIHTECIITAIHIECAFGQSTS